MDLRRLDVADSAPAPFDASRSLASLVTDLGSSDFARREAASDALLERARELEAALSSGAINAQRLSPEQRLRIDDALRTSFGQSPRPGMGIQFAPAQPGLNALTLARVVPNFPSATMLRAGDTIVAIDGERLRLTDPSAAARVRQHILSYNPGDVIEVVVQRAGDRLALRVPLGRFDQLDNQQSVPPPEDLLEAWEIRKQRLGFALIETAPIAPTPLSHEPAAIPDAPLLNQSAVQWFEDRAGVLPGGAPRVSPETAPAALGGAILAQRVQTQAGRLRDAGAHAVNEDIRSSLFRRLQELRLTEAQLRAHAANPNVPQEARQAASAQLNEVRKEIIEVTRSIRDNSR